MEGFRCLQLRCCTVLYCQTIFACSVQKGDAKKSAYEQCASLSDKTERPMAERHSTFNSFYFSAAPNTVYIKIHPRDRLGGREPTIPYLAGISVWKTVSRIAGVALAGPKTYLSSAHSLQKPTVIVPDDTVIVQSSRSTILMRRSDLVSMT